MDTKMLDTAKALSDGDLLARIPVLAAHERGATAQLVAHLAALRLRPSLYAAQGYGSLFAYCRRALRLSEDAAANRIHAARACLKFPLILDLLASGELSLSAVRMLRPYLTMENHERVLDRARNARRVDIERLVAELAPRPDVPSTVRKLPVTRTEPSSAPVMVSAQAPLPGGLVTSSSTLGSAEREGSTWDSMAAQSDACPAEVDPTCPIESDVSRAWLGLVPRPASVQRPVVQPLSPERYRVQFTIGQDAYDLLRRVQTLLRRDIPDGDTGAIFERALGLLHREVEAARFGRRPGGPRAYGSRIRPGADPAAPSRPNARRVSSPNDARGGHSRYVPKAVKQAVWFRDRGQCAFVSASGLRCVESEFLELHHIQPYALHGPTTVGNLALRCRRHNQYEGELVFGHRNTQPSLEPARGRQLGFPPPGRRGAGGG
jgi:hypothetical protein